jgi:hypothetical protein
LEGEAMTVIAVGTKTALRVLLHSSIVISVGLAQEKPVKPGMGIDFSLSHWRK